MKHTIPITCAGKRPTFTVIRKAAYRALPVSECELKVGLEDWLFELAHISFLRRFKHDEC